MDLWLCAGASRRRYPSRSGVIPGVIRSAWRGSLSVLLVSGILLPGMAASADTDGSVARITSTQNQVSTRSRGTETWSPSTLNQPLHGMDRVRTGAASRASILYADQTLQRLNEKSEIEIVAPESGNPGLLKVISGQHYFSSRTPKDYGRIETPTVTAAIKGTEFMVSVAADSTTTITMLEGVVEASNGQGKLEVRSGEQAYVEPGKAPVRRVLVHPRDAVLWSFYYPPVLGGSDLVRLKGMGSQGESLSRAAEMLSAGQVDAAKPLIDEAIKANPKDPVALSLASVIQTAVSNTAEATRLAGEAMAADPASPAAALAGSFAAQATFDIDRASELAEKAAQLDPGNATVLARAAELRMARGDLAGARKLADEAVKQAPGQARALSVLGFIQLAEFESAAAEKTFEDAVAADSGLPLAHLGLGIARIRRKQVVPGREELQTAVILDPNDSLLRSYLGKAFYEERRSPEATKELTTAKQLDPKDPTPYLYDATLLQNDNRPLEALQSMQASIERNDNRAVYRSRLLLDQDTATRSSDLARVYNDLGFDQLGLVTARRSADEDQANFSSHLFLSGNYRNAPNFAPAFFSEVLQARLYQPANVNAARPDLVNQTVSFNEYTALFDRPRARAFGGIEYGRTDTDISELVPNDPTNLCFPPNAPGGIPCSEALSLDHSGLWNGDVTGTLNGDHYAAALSYQKFQDDGFRVNNEQTLANYRGFFEYSPGYRDSFQANVQIGRRENGDLPLGDDPVRVQFQSQESSLTNIALGYHRLLSPSAHLVVSAIYNETTQETTDQYSGLSGKGTLKGPQIEVQSVFRQDANVSWIVGAGGFDGTVDFEQPAQTVSEDDKFVNGYAYAKISGLGHFEVTAGASVDHVVSPAGIITPENSAIQPAELTFSETRLNPKLGVSVYLPSKTTLRAAGYYRTSPSLGRIQTLEPTQVAGFNQFFDEAGGTRSLSYGAGVDQTFTRHLFGGLSVLRRDLNTPEAYCTTSDEFSACMGQTADQIIQRDSTNHYYSAYFNAALGKYVAAGLDYTQEKYDYDLAYPSLGSPLFFKDYVDRQRLRPQVRLYLPGGFFAGAVGTHYDQTVDQFDDLLSTTRTTIDSTFWIVDVLAGYKFPKRYGSVILQAKNVGDREFPFYDHAVEETIAPARTVSLRVNFTF
jgi:Tfp pilus assembly protein PilF